MDELLELLGKLDPKSVDAKKVADALKSNLQPVYQTIFDAGHDTAYSKGKDREKNLKEDLDTAQERVSKLEKDLGQLQEEKPDVGKIRTEYEQEIEKLKGQVKEARSEATARVNEMLVERAKADLTTELRELGVDPEWSNYLADKHATRFKTVEREIDGTKRTVVEVLAEGSSEVPIQAENPLKEFATQLRKDVKPQFIVSNAAGGGPGVNGGDGVSSGGRNGNKFDAIREQVKEERKSQSERSKEVDDRLAARSGSIG